VLNIAKPSQGCDNKVLVARTLFQKSGQTLLDLLFPPDCVHCHATNSWICPNCINEIAFITTTVCQRCGTPAPVDVPSLCKQCRKNPLQYVDGIRVAAYFEDNPIRSAIHSLKYRNHKALTSILSDMLVDAFYRYHLSADVIIPVPLHSSRLKERGYNQSELLARQLGRQLQLPVDTVSLHRIRKTKSQMTLGADERHRNVANAFSCNNTLFNQNILLIDDVCTTGSTLDFCAAALKERGVTSVWGLALARAH
jgi:ComF family protein